MRPVGFSVSVLSFAKTVLPQVLTAYFAAFALCNIGGFSPTGILSAVLFALTFCFFSLCRRRTEANAGVLPRRFWAVCRLLAALYTLFYVAAEHKNLAGGFDSRLFRLGFVLATAAGLFFLFSACCRLLMLFFSSRKPSPVPSPLSARAKAFCFLLLLLCWLPWFLYDYPGVMTPDSLSQFSQAAGLSAYSDHHPLLHTLLFQALYGIGFSLTQNVYMGIACYTLFQMGILAGVETFCLSILSRLGAPRPLLCGWIAFWGLLPYNGIFAVTIWKDVLFSAFLLLYTLCLLLLLSGTKTPRLPLFFLFFLSGWLSCMLRSNGPYVFLFLLPFVLWAFRRKNRAAAILHLAVLLLALIVKGPIYDRFGVEKPSFTESLSIPLQQVARVVSEGRPLTEQQEALIGQVVDVSLIPEYYEPSISDPVKALVSYNNADYLESHKGEFFRLWAELGLSWPRDYAEAFIDQTKGYWFPDRASLTVNEGISPNELGLSWPHLLRGQIPVKISELLLKMPDFLPLYGLLWSIGAYTWAALFLFAFQFLYGQRRYLLVYLPSLGTILTLLLATPVSSDLRYAYPLILAAPLLLTVPLCFGARLSRSIPGDGRPASH